MGRRVGDVYDPLIEVETRSHCQDWQHDRTVYDPLIGD